LGIKWREGKIEVKQRLHQHGVVNPHQQVSGLMEQWHKWSFPLAATSTDPMPDSLAESFWVAVKKVRTLCKYEVTSGRAVLHVPAGDLPEQGGQVELTRLTVQGSEWWTVGLEAWGKETDMRGNLHLLMERVFADSEPPVFQADDSYSYPQWLAQTQ
jgi:hypothetical protein